MPTSNRRQWEVITVDPHRLSHGTWCHEQNRQLDEGDIAASYSADVIAMHGRIRKPFVLRGCMFVCTGIGGHRTDAYRLVAERAFDGAPTTYSAKVRADGGEVARNDPKGFYHGVAVRHGGKTYVLDGPPIALTPGDPVPRQGCLFD